MELGNADVYVLNIFWTIYVALQLQTLCSVMFLTQTYLNIHFDGKIDDSWFWDVLTTDKQSTLF